MRPGFPSFPEKVVRMKRFQKMSPWPFSFALCGISLLCSHFSQNAVVAADDNSQQAKYVLPGRGICAHRGARTTFPENTIPAFKEAVRLGVQQIEFDVCRTKDGAMVLMHDPSVDRTTDGKGKVGDLTLEEIKRLDAGIKTGEQFKGVRVPTVEEAIDVFPRNIWLNVHLKKSPGLAPDIARLLKAKNRLHQAFLACTVEQAAEAREVCPQILICNMSRQQKTSAYVQQTIDTRCQFVQLIHKKYSPNDVATLKKAGIHINCFGTNDPDELKKMYDDGIDFPLVDKTSEMQEVAKEKGVLPQKEMKYD
jgi:glycerophosphoryl diester phosphodiesterase